MALMQDLGIAASRSRPAVSNDNPYSESCFRTLKYRPEFPSTPFDDVNAARHGSTALRPGTTRNIDIVRFVL